MTIGFLCLSASLFFNTLLFDSKKLNSEWSELKHLIVYDSIVYIDKHKQPFVIVGRFESAHEPKTPMVLFRTSNGILYSTDLNVYQIMEIGDRGILTSQELYRIYYDDHNGNNKPEEKEVVKITNIGYRYDISHHQDKYGNLKNKPIESNASKRTYK